MPRVSEKLQVGRFIPSPRHSTLERLPALARLHDNGDHYSSNTTLGTSLASASTLTDNLAPSPTCAQIAKRGGSSG